MATNLIAVNVYQIGQAAPIAVSQAGYNPMYLPSTGLIVQSVGLSATNPNALGVFTYSSIQTPNGSLFYSGLTASAVATLANA